jgi:hypothetical protein
VNVARQRAGAEAAARVAQDGADESAALHTGCAGDCDRLGGRHVENS